MLQTSSSIFEDEIDVLCSIYGDNISIDMDRQLNGIKATIIYCDQSSGCSIEFAVPAGYPVISRPKFTLSFESRIEALQKQALTDELDNLIVNSGEEVVIFSVVERLKEILPELQPEIECCIVPTLVENEVTETTNIFEENCSMRIVHGPILMEQKSSFQSHIAAVSSMEDVNMFRRTVLSDKKISRATHNIFAYRFTCPNGTGVVHHDHDDDGECAAGGRVAEMIRLMGIDGVAVIVSRWFGGVLLGPDRFKFICNSARNLLEENGYGKTPAGKKKS